MPRAGPRTVHRDSVEFKLTAVRLTEQLGIQVQIVAQALAIHPFMLSKWRRDARDRKLRCSAKKAPPPAPAREIANLQGLEKAHAILQEEHDLLKKAIRFCPARRQTSSPDSRHSGGVRKDVQCDAALPMLYGVTRAGFYAWRQRPASAHAEQDRELLTRITQIFQAHEGRYGSPVCTADSCSKVCT